MVVVVLNLICWYIYMSLYYSGSLGHLVGGKSMHATYWEVLVRTGSESHWCRISLAVPVSDCKQFKFSPKPEIAGIHCGG